MKFSPVRKRILRLTLVIGVLCVLLTRGIINVIKDTRAFGDALEKETAKAKAMEPLQTTSVRFTLEGHRYLSLRTNHSFGDTILHDPNCPCQRLP